MKKISYLATMLAALFMVACTSNDIPGDTDNGAQGDRVLKINIEKLATKTEHPGVLANTFTKVEHGVIYFFDNASANGGNAVFSYTLTKADITTLEGAGASPTSQNIYVSNVPATATKVIMLTNYNGGDDYPAFTGKTFNDISNLSFNIKDKQPVTLPYENNAVDKVVMTDDATITTKVDASNNTTLREAQIELKPVLSRFEIGAVRCISVTGTVPADKPTTFGEGQITKFRLRGVFIPNHYTSGSVFGVGAGDLVKPTVEANYGTSFPMTIGTGYLRDYFDGDNTLKKISDNYFAYHVFPANGADKIPNIVVAVDEIWFIDLDGQEKKWKTGAIQYFTVTKYNSESGSVAAFEAAKIYRITGTDPGTQLIDPATGNPPVDPADPNAIEVTLPGGEGGVEFGLGDLTDKPYDKDKTVVCNITILPWTIVTITPSK